MRKSLFFVMSLFMGLSSCQYYETSEVEEEDVETDEVDDRVEVLPETINGRWSGETQDIEIQESKIIYTFEKGTSNECTFTCAVKEKDEENGFFAVQIKGASMNGSDVTMAYENDYTVFYYKLEGEYLNFEGRGGAMVKEENLHLYHEEDRNFVKLSRVEQ